MRRLTDVDRTDLHNLRLGWLLAFNAGALNAGGFLMVHRYTSHMTGFVSMLADNLVLGQSAIVLGALGTLLAFLCGATCTTLMVCWARQRQLRSSYALPLLLIAALMLMLGVLGAVASNWSTPFAVPVAVLLLAFIMGLQNAVMTQMSASTVRTTHMTGVMTDIGIELGKWLYARPSVKVLDASLHPSKSKLVLFVGLLLMFFVGGVIGAAGFKHLGFGCVLPLALVLMLLALPPLWADRARLSVPSTSS